MSRIRAVLLAVFLLLLFGGAYEWHRINEENLGIPRFYVWERLSGQDHGAASVPINGVRIFYKTYGHGSPVLVLHGGTAFMETMHYQIQALARDHLVIAPDSRAHGRSTDGSGPLTYAQMSDDMLALMDRLHIQKADVVGWSDGGIIALDLAMRHPDRIGRIVTMGANYDVSGLVDDGPTPGANSPEAASRRDFYQRIAPDPAHWPIFYGKVVQMWRTQPNYTTADLARIKSPALIIAGEHDGIKRAHTDALAHAIPGAHELIIPGATHLAPVEKPKLVDAAVVRFLAP